ncbi:MAG: hypothetical protein AAGJ40_02755 [Planctomycetota bacterium]
MPESPSETTSENAVVHTPGPWSTDGTGEGLRVVTDRQNATVCRMSWLAGRQGMGGRRKDREVFANARLVAAAPDLLKACKDALQGIQNYQSGNTDTTEDAEMILIDVIHQAGGQVG